MLAFQTILAANQIAPTIENIKYSNKQILLLLSTYVIPSVLIYYRIVTTANFLGLYFISRWLLEKSPESESALF